MRFQKTISTILLAFTLGFMGCSDPGETTSSVTSGSSSVSSSSSGEGGAGGMGGQGGSGGKMELVCDSENVVKTCEECKMVGCEFNKPTETQCYGGVVFYTDMIGCLQWPAVQDNCPECKDISAGQPITSACETCGKEYANETCVFSCKENLGTP